MKEVWLDIEGYPNYQVSSIGRVRPIIPRYSNVTILKPIKHKNGYVFVNLTTGKYKSTILSVHRLVAKAFIRNLLGKPDINHKNGTKDDNRTENLEWCTKKENVKHSWDNGFSKRLTPLQSGNRKLEPEQVLAILGDDRPQKEIANDYGVYPNTVSRIKSGKRWGELHTFFHKGVAPEWLYLEAEIDHAKRVLSDG